MVTAVAGKQIRMAVSMLLLAATAQAQAAGAGKVDFKIKAQPMQEALSAFAQQSGYNVLFQSKIAADAKAPSVTDTLTPRAALEKLLANSGLRYKFIDDETVSIQTAKAAASSNSAAPTADSLAGGTAIVHLAQSSAAGDTESQAGATLSASGNLAEVIVTAQKREERLQDVPVPVTAISGEVLTQSNQLRLQDYYSKIPGLNLTPTGFLGDAQLSIRGIPTSSSGQAAVATLIDDVPFGTPLGRVTAGVPDIDPGDLARVEVLRGPQGTLYGVSSMGGLLKFVTVEPSTEKFSGRVQVGISSLFNGVSPGYNVRGSVNVPVNDSLAIRASAFSLQEPGYIENIQNGKTGANRRTSDGGRFAMLWKPSETWSLKLSALIQDTKRDGADVATFGSGFGDLQTKYTPNTQTVQAKTQAYSATLKADFGGVQLSSLTGYNVDHRISYHDFTFVNPNGDGTFFWDSLANTYLHTTGPGSSVLDKIDIKNLSEELRLSIPIGEKLTWLIGGFYTDEKATLTEGDYGANPANGIHTVEPFLANSSDQKYKEYALFTTVTYAFTDQFDVQAGGRRSDDRQVFNNAFSGPVASVFGLGVAPESRVKDTPFTYLVTPRYKLSPDTMVYARFASGYRPGGTNSGCGFGGVPCGYAPEKTKNYELGFKGDFLDHRISLDASIFRIDWTDIQVGLTLPGAAQLGYVGNAGDAKSQGVELSVNVRPTEGLTVSGWIDYTDAKFTKDFPDDGILDGQRLAFSSRFSGNLSAEEAFVVNSSLTALLGSDISYIGNRPSNTDPKVLFPGYAQANAHAGLRYDAWTFTAFINNVLDKRGILGGGIDYQFAYAHPNTYSIIQPRIFGLNVARTF